MEEEPSLARLIITRMLWILAFGVIILGSLYFLFGKTDFKIFDSDSNVKGIHSTQIIWNGAPLTDSTIKNPDNTCTATRNGMTIKIEPCIASDIDGRNIVQYVNFTWKGNNSQNVGWVFVYDSQIESGGIEAWRNITKTKQSTRIVNEWVSNYLVDRIVSYTDLGTPDARCEIGNTNNTRMFDVVRQNPSNQSSTIYCFTSQTAVNSTAFRISGNYYASQSYEETYYEMEFKDITSQIQFLGVGLLDDDRAYYRIESSIFQPDQSIYTRWTFTPKDATKNGKWQILGYNADLGLAQSLNSNQYIYIDPWWNSNWMYKKEITFTGAFESDNSSVFIPIEKVAGHMNDTCTDLRFTSDSTPTAVELPYWIRYTNSTHCVVFVNVRSYSSIYMFYGNPAVASTSDMFQIADTASTIAQLHSVGSGLSAGTTQGEQGVTRHKLMLVEIAQNVSGTADIFRLYNATNGIITTVNVNASGLKSWQIYPNSSFSGILNNNTLYKFVFTGSVAWTRVFHGAAVSPAYSFSSTNMNITGGVGGSLADDFNDYYQMQNLTTIRISTPTVAFGDELTQIDITTTASYPGAYANITDNTPTIACNFTGIQQNVTTIIVDVYDMKNNLDFRNTTSLSGNLSVNFTTISSALPDGKYNWSCYGFGNNGVNSSSGNRTFTVDAVNMTSPVNYQKIRNSTVALNYTILTSADMNLTLYIWLASTGATQFTNTTEVTTSTSVNVTSSLLSDGNYTWNLYMCTSGTNCEFDTNKSFTIDTAPLAAYIIYPTAIITTKNFSYFNWTFNDYTDLQACWYTNISGQTNIITCGDNSTFFDDPIDWGKEYQMILYANDTWGNNAQPFILNFTPVNISMGTTFNEWTFETVSNTYATTINKSNNVSVVPYLIYDSVVSLNISNVSTRYTATYSPPALSGIVWNATKQARFGWNFTFAGVNITFYSPNINQTVSQMLMYYCSGNYTMRVINVTFRDEVTNEVINATLDSSSWTYAPIVGTRANKTFVYSNSSNHNYNYAFCLYPHFANGVTASATLQASKSDSATYPQRKYNILNTIYYNYSQENITMYLLNYNNGITSSYQVITIGNQVIAGAYIEIEREIGGTLTKVADGYTDSSGILTAFLNPNYQHTITVSKSGYSNVVVNVYPSQSIYTITMGSTTGYFVYNFTTEGITYSKWPSSGIITRGVYNFTFRVDSRISNIYNCTMQIRYPNATVIGSNKGCNVSVPNTGGEINLTVNITKIAKEGVTRLYGTYTYATDAGTYVVESDANWRLYDGNYTDYIGTLRSALNDSMNMPEWGGCPDGYILNSTDSKWCYNSAGDTIPRESTQDFNRIVFFFLFMAILLAILNFYTGYDTAYPGAFIYIVTAIVVILSAIGGFAGQGWFYLDGAISSDYVGTYASKIFDNWIVAIHFVLLSLIYFFTTNKRYQSG